MKNNKTDTTIETYNKVVDEYINYYNSKNLNGKVQFQKEIDYLIKQLPNNSVVLDVGTSVGSYPKYLTEQCPKNYKVIGIDAATNMIKVAKKNAPKANFAVMDMRNLKYSKNSFDAILCLATLIHVDDEDCQKILDKFDFILKDKGFIIINVLELKNNDKELFESDILTHKYKTYFNRYNRQYFVDYFAGKGYQILKFFDNELFNKAIIKSKTSDDNQFSIIVQKP